MYRYITNEKRLKQVKKFIYLNKVFTVDTETTGTGNGDWSSPFGSKIVLIQIGNDKIQYVINAAKVDITPILKLIANKKYLKVFQNGKFDYKVIKTNYGITINNIFDTMLASQILTTGYTQYNHGLYDISERYLGYRPDGKLSNGKRNKKCRQLSLFENIDKSIRTSFDKLTKDHIVYAAKDIELTHQLYIKLDKLLKDNKLDRLAKVEFEFSLVLGDMELNGMPLNIPNWLVLADKVKLKLADAEEVLSKYAEINWNSWAQVNKVFKANGIDTSFIDRATGLVKESVSAAKMKKFISIPIVKDYLYYKEIGKQESSYGVNFLKNIDPVTNRIHSSFIQIKITGRTGSTDVNMQNIPRKGGFRECFESDTSFLLCDYSSQEIGVLAERSGDQTLRDVVNSGRDIHGETASRIYNTEVTKEKNTELRSTAKNGIFLTIYGGGPSKLSETTNIPVTEAKNVIKGIYSLYPGIEKHFIKQRKSALTNGYIIADSIYKRKIYLANHERYKQLDDFINYFEARLWKVPRPIKDEHSKLKSEIERVAQNYEIQSSAALMAKIAGIYLRRYTLRHPKVFKISLLVHDEWIVEKLHKKADEILVKCMETAARIVCPHVTIRPELKETKIWTK